MSSCGAGRGRGWLNLNSNSEPPKPMGLSKPPLINNEPPNPMGLCKPLLVNNEPPKPMGLANPSLINNAGPAQSNCEHQDLVKRIGEISINDDGIMFNKKMQYIQGYWLQDCSSQEEVETSFKEVYNACLSDADLGSKLVALMASRSFISQKIHGCDLRREFLKNLQQDFENSNQLQTTNPLMFRNCVHMIGEFYSKAKLSTGQAYNFLAPPFLSCLELLLNSKNLPDLIVFTNQLFLNGSNLKTIVPEELAKLGIKIRTILVNEPQLIPEAKLWLLLALDLYTVRFGLISPEVYKFYESQLGSAALINFQRSHDALSIQTVHASKVLDSYQSNVNVLQISTSPTEALQNDVQASHYTNSSEFNGTHQNSFPKDLSQKNKEKPGRPILGVGARFIKNKGSEDNNGAWNGKQNSSSSRGQSKKLPLSVKNNKGWEHDDRFETDYN